MRYFLAQVRPRYSNKYFYCHNELGDLANLSPPRLSHIEACENGHASANMEGLRTSLPADGQPSESVLVEERHVNDGDLVSRNMPGENDDVGECVGHLELGGRGDHAPREEDHGRNLAVHVPIQPLLEISDGLDDLYVNCGIFRVQALNLIEERLSICVRSFPYEKNNLGIRIHGDLH